MIFCIYWTVGLTANLVARRISDEQETKWFSGERVVSLVGLDVVDGTDVLDFSRCKDLLSAMTAGGSLRQLPYNMHLSNSKTPNAFAVPGGHIIVTQGLLDLVKSDMGLAMVLAYELGHHQFWDPSLPAEPRKGKVLAMAFLVLLSAALTIAWISGFPQRPIIYAVSVYIGPPIFILVGLLRY